MKPASSGSFPKYTCESDPRCTSPGEQPLSAIEWITLLHVGTLAVGTTWAFGGQADWVRTPIASWASLSGLITASALRNRNGWRHGLLQPLVWLSPLAAFNLITLVACLNPSLREVTVEGERLLALAGSRPWWPSTARPARALETLWLFDAIWLSAFNLVLVVRRRRALRGLLLVLVANALVLAVFGTVQELSHATGLYFDAVVTRQPRFFASFVYHNHWSAFVLLMAAAGIGLTWHYVRHVRSRDLLHSPIPAGLAALLLLVATLPLSGSRSGTLLALALCTAVIGHLVWRVLERRRSYRESVALPVAGIGLALALLVSGAWFVGADTIRARIAKSREQLDEMREIGGLGDRALLYRNTWRMALDKPWFGWGMASYPHVFLRFYNTRESKADRLPVFYNDAHNDWLQSLAEHGFLGTILLALCAILPLRNVCRDSSIGTLSGYLLAGCLLILFYATLEFPFGNLAVVLYWWLLFFCAIQLVRLRQVESGTSP